MPLNGENVYGTGECGGHCFILRKVFEAWKLGRGRPCQPQALCSQFDHKLRRGQLCKPVPQMPVDRGGPPQVVVVAQEVDVPVVVPGDGTENTFYPICSRHVRSASLPR